MYGLLLSNTHSLGTYFPVKYTEGSSKTFVPTITDLCCTPLQVNNILEQPKRHFCDIGNVSCNKLINPVPPFFESFFDAVEFQNLKIALSQLYPHSQVVHISRCFKRFGKIYLGESLIGSLLPGGNSKSSSVVEAFWAGSGDDLKVIDYRRPRVGVVQFFALHTTIFKDE